jgi:L-alanine-DL-glutamate epimerase-like enolase superfamily enzyme
MALWDLKGKAMGVPVYELLGGAKSDSLRLYASGGIDKAPDDLARELAGYVAAGFSAVKIRARWFQLDKVRISRKAIGHDVALIVDAAQSFQAQPYRFHEALRFAERLAEWDVAFLEEPLGVEDLEGHRLLAKRSPVPISGGETVTSAVELKRLLDDGVFHIAQPDAAVIGGIGECLDVLRHADYLGLKGVCHAWASAPAQAANIHAAFAAGSEMLEWAMPHNPLREALLSEPWRLCGGRLQRPTAPGLGVRLTEEALREFAYVPGSANPGRIRPTD